MTKQEEINQHLHTITEEKAKLNAVDYRLLKGLRHILLSNFTLLEDSDLTADELLASEDSVHRINQAEERIEELRQQIAEEEEENATQNIEPQETE